MKKLWLRTTPIDRWLILVVALLSLMSLFLLINRTPGRQVVIYRGDQVTYLGPLDQERFLEVQGPLGITRVEIAAGKVRVLDSPCPAKICIQMGDAELSGDLLACVPNRVVIRIEGKEARGYDLLSR